MSTTTTGLGREAEALVEDHLRRIGLEILATNVRLGYLEIDIVAREGPVIAVVEVRRRNSQSFTTAFGSVGARKRLFVRRAGERLWSRYFKNEIGVERLRYDVASVQEHEGQFQIEYVRGAFY
jgi:putative endonuclease